MGKYTLIIAEKPAAAQRIASALDVSQKAMKMEDKGVPYYVVRRDRDIVVVPALGHLYTVSDETDGKHSYPVFGYKWKPRFLAEKGAGRTRVWLEVITRLSKDADAFVDACDYDMEGSVIGYCILKYACGDKENRARRMRYSTLIKEELERSYDESLPHLDFALIEAGMARHEIDWLYGINLSRALTQAAKRWSGKYSTLSTGRVQGPLLKFLVSREKSIRSFVPTPYWQIRARLSIGGQSFTAEYAKVIETRKEAGNISNACKGVGRVKKVCDRKFQQFAPVPFDLGSLQAEAYRLFRFSPRRTLEISKRLYLQALISYPRTSSQKLPSATDYRSVLENLGKIQEYGKLATKLLTKSVLKPHQGSRDDPAHPAIYPTGNLPERSLTNNDRSLWDLIVRRFMAVFGDPAFGRSVKIIINIDKHVFYVGGKRTLEQGWQQFYEPYARSEESVLPNADEGEPVYFEKTILKHMFTKPPPRYNPSSLLQKMDKAGIGTKATRADVIQTLYERKYVRNEKIAVTDLGFEICEILRNYCPKVVSVEMTKELEDRINGMCRNSEKKEDVLTNIIGALKPVLKHIKQEEREIGERLDNAVKRTRLEESVIGGCPICKTGQLVMIYSKKTRKRFAGCTNYFEGSCNASFALPQDGQIKLHHRNCVECKWPTVEVHRGRRRWVLCLNPDCPLKEAKKN